MKKFQNFMMGRYGPDELYSFLFVVYLIVLIVNLFIGSSIISILAIGIVVIMFYRFFSKNIMKRRKENGMYLKLKKKILKPFGNLKRNYQERNVNVYRKCHACKKTLKLPIPETKGIKTVKCPKCGQKTKVLVLRSKQKEKIIKPKKVKENVKC